MRDLVRAAPAPLRSSGEFTRAGRTPPHIDGEQPRSAAGYCSGATSTMNTRAGRLEAEPLAGSEDAERPDAKAGERSAAGGWAVVARTVRLGRSSPP